MILQIFLLCGFPFLLLTPAMVELHQKKDPCRQVPEIPITVPRKKTGGRVKKQQNPTVKSGFFGFLKSNRVNVIEIE